MKLMTKEIERKMPALYSTEEVAGEDKILRVKYFTPWAGWTWYVVEGCAIIEYEDKTREEVSLQSVRESMYDLWKNRKSGTISKNIPRQNQMQSLCKQSNSTEQEETRYHERKESCMEGGATNKLGVCIPTKTRTSKSKQTGVCKKSESIVGGKDRNISTKRNDITSQGYGQEERQLREFNSNDNLRAYEVAQQRENEFEIHSRKIHVIDIMFFGFVDGMDSEWGYFSLEELESIRGPFRLKIERDLYFKPCKLKERR